MIVSIAREVSSDQIYEAVRSGCGLQELILEVSVMRSRW